MRPPGFPFPALVGLDPLKMALQLAAIDRRLSVLIRGDKGAGKSTAARGLVELLEPGSPFINLPIGATEDRLLGGLDVASALKGEPVLKRGLLAEANGGVLYVDEVNLLPAHLADALLDAAASGVHVLEREGFSASETADFVMVGSMNPEEGALRPQLLDRFALAVDVCAPMAPDVRRDVIERRLLYDFDPTFFCERWREERTLMARRIAEARARFGEVIVPGDVLDLIAQRVSDQHVRSLRADLAVVRGSRALAALEGASCVEAAHVERVLPLALAHRAHVKPPDRRPDPPPPRRDRDPGERDRGGAAAEDRVDRVFVPTALSVPRLVVEAIATRPGGSSESGDVRRGTAVGTRLTPEPRELDPRATLLHAVTRSGTAMLREDDLHERLRLPRTSTRYVFVVDSSGSHAVQERMCLVKGAIRGLLENAPGLRDEVMVIACRGGAARVVVEPTSLLADAQRALEYLPTGGRTPLAHALELAAAYVTDASVVILVTDGHANVASRSDDPWADTLAAARTIRCPTLVIDSERRDDATGRPSDLAEAMAARCVRLEDLDELSILPLMRHTS